LASNSRFTVAITGTDRMTAKLEAISGNVRARLADAIQSETLALIVAAQARMDELFKNGGGKMRDSMTSTFEDDGAAMTGTVTAAGLPYLAIQEFGGTTSPHDIFPVNAAVLAFFGQASAQFLPGGDATGPLVFAKAVHHPGSVMPERSYLRAALARRRSDIRAALAAAVQAGVAES
jgi:phage gpG-like protein